MSRRSSCSWLVALLLVSLVVPEAARSLAAQVRPASRAQDDLAFFERKAALSKELGATHVLVTEGLPLATWQIDPPDPYPMWFVGHAGMLTIFPPKDMQPYVNAAYSAKVSGLIRERCGVLRRIGLKAVWNANEPEVLPESFFEAHPELRGARIDQPNRSRKIYFAPNVDEPEMLRLYRESMQALLEACPEMEQFNWVTTDAGSGFDWVPALYPGVNGNSAFRDRPLSDRVAGFLINAQQAAKSAGHDIQIRLTPIAERPWMVPTFAPDVLENIIRKLPRGIAVQGKEGPDGRPFEGVVARGSGPPFSPVVGIIVPPVNNPPPGLQVSPNRYLINFGDATTIDFNYRYLKFTRNLPMRTLAERVTALRAFAASEAGEQQADNLVEAWNQLNEAQTTLNVLDFGPMLRFGHVLNRWITRPMVPFPEELTAEDTRDYRPYLFQAKGDEQAANLIDIQAMRMYEGWGARLLFQRDIEVTMPRVRRAITLIDGLARAAKDDSKRHEWELISKRLQALADLLQSANNMVCYQAQLDRVKSLGNKPEANPVLGTQSGWDRTDLMQLARDEIDTMVDLGHLLESTQEPILDLAPTPGEETVMRLGPNTGAAIKHKIGVMNAHWRDYDRLFTSPNP